MAAPTQFTSPLPGGMLPANGGVAPRTGALAQAPLPPMQSPVSTLSSAGAAAPPNANTDTAACSWFDCLCKIICCCCCCCNTSDTPKTKATSTTSIDLSPPPSLSGDWQALSAERQSALLRQHLSDAMIERMNAIESAAKQAAQDENDITPANPLSKVLANGGLTVNQTDRKTREPVLVEFGYDDIGDKLAVTIREGQKKTYSVYQNGRLIPPPAPLTLDSTQKIG